MSCLYSLSIDSLHLTFSRQACFIDTLHTAQSTSEMTFVVLYCIFFSLRRPTFLCRTASLLLDTPAHENFGASKVRGRCHLQITRPFQTEHRVWHEYSFGLSSFVEGKAQKTAYLCGVYNEENRACLNIQRCTFFPR